ncbi:MAG: tetratricopeptide repeat protein [Candidatus Competibacteraceae bacterium]
MKTKISKRDQQLAQARMLHESGNLDAAEALYRKMLRKIPGDVETLFQLGTIKVQQGVFDAAEPLLRQVLALQPQHVRALNNLGVHLSRVGRHEEALPLIELALKLDPDCADTLNNLGYVLKALDRLDEAEAAYRRVIELEPRQFEGPYNLGLVLNRRERWDEAATQLQRALELVPDRPETLNELGLVYHYQGQWTESTRLLQQALALRPDFFDAHNNLAVCLNDQGRWAEALAHYRTASVLRPADPRPGWNAAYVELSLGSLHAGWADYELRWQTQGEHMHPPFPVWQGEDLAGRSILVYPEQGLGDEILFASCIPDLLEKAQQVVVICEQRLGALYTRSFPKATVYAVREPNKRDWSCTLPPSDYQIAIGSLPRLLRTRVDDFPNRAAYLRSDPAQAQHWRRRLAELGPGLKIGLCWRSGMLITGRHRYYPAITDCEPLLKTPGVVFINLQYDDCAEELAEVQRQFGVTLHQFPGLDLRNDQDGVAALMTALDGVISAPTAVSELAAALGVPVLRHDISWTSLGTDYMPWHPTMRLFKTDPHEPWTTVTSAMAAALGEWVAQAGHANVPLQFAGTRYGSMLVGGAGAAARDLWRTGEHAPEALAVLTSLLRPGDWVVEAGADLGAFTLPLAQAVGATGLVIACEPRRDAFQLLCANLALNGLEQVHAEKVALDATMPGVDAKVGAEWRRMRLPPPASIDTLDLPRCDLICIGEDTDALAVITGARAICNRLKPFIYIRACVNLPAVSELLSALGYAWQVQNQGDAVVDILGYPVAIPR